MPEALATRDAVAEQVGGLRFSYQHFDWGSERYLAHGAIMAEDGPAGATSMRRCWAAITWRSVSAPVWSWPVLRLPRR
jgi:hypothetical protein